MIKLPPASTGARFGPCMEVIDKLSIGAFCWGMSWDLTELLKAWPHEAGELQVRIVEGLDGRGKLQVRLDLGVIQMELDGRPDGQRPHGCESLLDHHIRLAAQAGGDYELKAGDCAELQAEGVQYYHRYVSLMHIEEFGRVARDTARNLKLFDFVRDHCPEPEHVAAFEQFRPYVIMMHTRARAAEAARSGRLNAARKIVEEGRNQIAESISGREPGDPLPPEVAALNEWASEFLNSVTPDPRELLSNAMEEAIREEAYERAAELRDQLRALEAASAQAGNS